MASPRSNPLIPLAALAASAVLFYFGTGFDPVAALAWLAPLPVFLLATRTRAWVAALVGFLAYFFGTANSWGFYLESQDVPMPFGVVICVGSALVFMLATLAFRALVARGRLLLAAAVPPAIWSGALFLVATFNPAGVMGTMAWSQADVPVVLQLASVTGVWGVEYLVLFVPAAVAAVVTGTPRAARLRTGVVVAAVLVVVIGGGAWRLAGSTDGESNTVALVVRNEPQWGTDLATSEGQAALTSYAEQIADLPDGVDYVVMPEGSFAADLSDLDDQLAPIAAVAKDRDVDVIVGVVVRDGEKKYNTAIDVPASGEPAVYKKWHDSGWQITLGHELVTSPGDAAVGLMVCMDVNHAGPIDEYAADGARLVLIPAADEDQNGKQHARTALIRGVENGVSVAWAAQRGALMSADGLGHVVGESQAGASEPGEFSVTIADVQNGPGKTLYTQWGDWFGWLCVVVAIIGVPVGLLSRRR